MRLFLLLIVVVTALSACATATVGGYGQGGLQEDGRSYQQARVDNQLSAEVIGALIEDRQVHAIDLRVRVRHGIVTLSGTVSNRSIANRAVAIAEAVEGVKRVDDQMVSGR